MRPLVLVGLLLAGCGDPPLLELVVTTPQGPDPLAGVDSLRLLVTNPAGETTESVQDPSSFSVEVEVEAQSEVGSILLEGYTAGKLAARGETPPMVLRPVDDRIVLLVAAAGELSPLRPRLGAAGREMTTLLLPGLGVLLAGGLDGAGKVSSAVELYDFLEHRLVPQPTLVAPSTGAVAAICGSHCAVLATGADEQGLATRLQRFDGTAWESFADGLAPGERRARAGIAPLDDGTFVIVGGQGPAGAQRSVLLLEPGQTGSDPRLTVLPSTSPAARVAPALAASGGIVLAAGGQGAGEPAAELFYASSSSFQPVTLPGTAPSEGTAAVELGDGRLAIVGGRDEAGQLITDGWIVDPVSLKVTHRGDALTQGRAGHRVLRVGDRLLVLGGTLGPSLADQAEVLSAKDLSNLGATPMSRPREAFGAVLLGKGSALVAGGGDARGSVDVLEIYETDVPSS